MLIRDIPEELMRSVKSICAARGVTLRDAVIALLIRFVQENGADASKFEVPPKARGLFGGKS